MRRRLRRGGVGWRMRRERCSECAAPCSLEELDSDEVVVRVTATPLEDSDGPQLADEILAGLAEVTREVDDEREREPTER